MVGCSVELRLLRNISRPLLLLEIGYLVLLGLGLWALSYGFSQGNVEGAALWAVCGLCAACWMRQSRRGSTTKKRGTGWLPSASALAGLFLAGVGLMQLRPGGFEMRLPLGFPSVVVVEGTWAECGSCLVLGALVGLIVDLATRGLSRGYLYYMIAVGLLLGSGMASALGLEPLWVGAVAGIWLVNATMRRLDILRALEQGQDMVRTVLPGVAGWALGAALVEGGFELVFGAWVFLALVAVVPGDALRGVVWDGEAARPLCAPAHWRRAEAAFGTRRLGAGHCPELGGCSARRTRSGPFGGRALGAAADAHRRGVGRETDYPRPRL